MFPKEILDFIKEDIKDLKSDIKTLDEKLDTLLEFKWKIAGATFLLSILLTGIFQIGMVILKH